MSEKSESVVLGIRCVRLQSPEDVEELEGVLIEEWENKKWILQRG